MKTKPKPVPDRHIGFKLADPDYVALGVIAARIGTSRSALAKEQTLAFIRKNGAA